VAAAGVRLDYERVNGAAPALTDPMAGQIQMPFDSSAARRWRRVVQ